MEAYDQFSGEVADYFAEFNFGQYYRDFSDSCAYDPLDVKKMIQMTAYFCDINKMHQFIPQLASLLQGITDEECRSKLSVESIKFMIAFCDFVINNSDKPPSPVPGMYV